MAVQYLDIEFFFSMVKTVEGHCWFQAYATVASAAEGKDPDSEEYGKVDELKQYPSFTKSAT